MWDRRADGEAIDKGKKILYLQSDPVSSYLFHNLVLP
jgi:hypothetical protein